MMQSNSVHRSLPDTSAWSEASSMSSGYGGLWFLLGARSYHGETNSELPGKVLC
jgi:hypothetical protein